MAGNIAPVKTKVSGLILAGGEGRRVAARDKGLLQWRGQRLVERVHNRIHGQVDPIFISCNRNLETYAAFASAVFADRRGNFQGPLAGLEAVQPHVATKFILVVPCDTPLLPLDLTEQLLAPLLADPSLEITYARAHGRDHYLCAVIRQPCLASLSAYLDNGGRAVRHWYAEHRVQAVTVRAADDAFLNINALPD